MLGMRPMVTEDVPRVLSLFTSVFGRVPVHSTFRGHSPDSPNFVVESGEAIVGYVAAWPWAPDILELTDLLIVPSRQGRGLGSDLVRRMEESCHERFRAVVVVNSDHYDAGSSGKRDSTDFYRRLGYDVIGRTPGTRVLWKSIERRAS